VAADLLHEECRSAAHPCFTDKMRLWRSGEGSLASRIPWDWKGPSVGERQKRVLAEAKAGGVSDPQPVADKYRWV
jgi:hypothetical protein